MAVHEPDVVVDVAGAKGGYVHRPICSCGWRYGRRYVSFFAAMIVAEDHARAEEVVVMP